MAPESFFSDRHKARLAKMSQMSGHFRLRNLQRFNDIANTQLPVLQEIQYPQASSIAERPKHNINMAGRCALIHHKQGLGSRHSSSCYAIQTSFVFTMHTRDVIILGGLT